MFEGLHAAVTRWRRRHPGRQRHLTRPVVSIGNLAVGGRAKTPMVEAVANLLLAAGERPAVLSRGYAREHSVETPVVVRDADGIRASLAESGDEPLMLAERLNRAIVVVHPDRGRAGAIAEQLGATVHLLDDGFQHLSLARDVDIVMLEAADLEGRVMPAGRLRESTGALIHADAIVLLECTTAEREAAVARLSQLSRGNVFSAARRVAPPPPDVEGERCLLVSGIAGETQLSRAVRSAGWHVAAERVFKDHHRYSTNDAASIVRDAGAANAVFVLTTAKDAVRLREVWRVGLALHIAELKLAIEPADGFRAWLIDAVSRARAGREALERQRREDGARRAS